MVGIHGRWARPDPPFFLKEAMKPVDLKALTKLIEPAVDGQGYELVDLEWTRGLSGWVLRVTIDRLPGQGHVSHQDCVAVSREASALLDVHDVLPGAYSLEVSSPGVDRPLKKGRDFARFIGKKAKFGYVPMRSRRLRCKVHGSPTRCRAATFPERSKRWKVTAFGWPWKAPVALSL